MSGSRTTPYGTPRTPRSDHGSGRFPVRRDPDRTARTGAGVRAYGPYGVRVRGGWCTGAYAAVRGLVYGAYGIGAYGPTAVRAYGPYGVPARTRIGTRTRFPYGRAVRGRTPTVALGRTPYGAVRAYGPVRGRQPVQPVRRTHQPSPYGRGAYGHGRTGGVVRCAGVRAYGAYGESRPGAVRGVDVRGVRGPRCSRTGRTGAYGRPVRRTGVRGRTGLPGTGVRRTGRTGRVPVRRTGPAQVCPPRLAISWHACILTGDHLGGAR
jgi:hypothetical protein